MFSLRGGNIVFLNKLVRLNWRSRNETDATYVVTSNWETEPVRRGSKLTAHMQSRPTDLIQRFFSLEYFFCLLQRTKQSTCSMSSELKTVDNDIFCNLIAAICFYITIDVMTSKPFYDREWCSWDEGHIFVEVWCLEGAMFFMSNPSWYFMISWKASTCLATMPGFPGQQRACTVTWLR